MNLALRTAVLKASGDPNLTPVVADFKAELEAASDMGRTQLIEALLVYPPDQIADVVQRSNLGVAGRIIEAVESPEVLELLASSDRRLAVGELILENDHCTLEAARQILERHRDKLVRRNNASHKILQWAVACGVHLEGPSTVLYRNLTYPHGFDPHPDTVREVTPPWAYGDVTRVSDPRWWDAASKLYNKDEHAQRFSRITNWDAFCAATNYPRTHLNELVCHVEDIPTLFAAVDAAGELIWEGGRWTPTEWGALNLEAGGKDHIRSDERTRWEHIRHLTHLGELDAAWASDLEDGAQLQRYLPKGTAKYVLTSAAINPADIRRWFPHIELTYEEAKAWWGRGDLTEEDARWAWLRLSAFAYAEAAEEIAVTCDIVSEAALKTIRRREINDTTVRWWLRHLASHHCAPGLIGGLRVGDAEWLCQREGGQDIVAHWLAERLTTPEEWSTWAALCDTWDGTIGDLVDVICSVGVAN